MPRGSPLFIDPEDVIFHNQPTLRYQVFIDVLEVEDWHTPSVSLSSGRSDTSSDGDDYVCPAFSGPWPKRTHFLDGSVGDGQEEIHGPVAGVRAAPLTSSTGVKTLVPTWNHASWSVMSRSHGGRRRPHHW
jgi:hypothetical protein